MYSVSDAVREVLSEMTFLQLAIDNDLLNYSAVARFIQPMINSRLGQPASIDAIAVAVRRHVETVNSDTRHNLVLDAIKNTRVILRTDLSMVIIQDWRETDVLKDLSAILRSIDFEAGEKFYWVVRSNQIMVICNSRFLPSVLSSVTSPAKVTFKESELATITVNVQSSVFDVPGILQFYSQQFDHVGVNVREAFSTRGKITFLFQQKDVARAYESISAALDSTKSINS